MPSWSDAQNWLDIIDHLWIGFVVILTAGIPSWFAARNGRSIKKVTDQVVNGHKTPLRADVDGIRDTLQEIHADVRGVKSDLSDVRSELSQERKDRLELDDRFEKFKRGRRGA